MVSSLDVTNDGGTYTHGPRNQEGGAVSLRQQSPVLPALLVEESFEMACMIYASVRVPRKKKSKIGTTYLPTMKDFLGPEGSSS